MYVAYPSNHFGHVAYFTYFRCIPQCVHFTCFLHLIFVLHFMPSAHVIHLLEWNCYWYCIHICVVPPARLIYFMFSKSSIQTLKFSPSVICGAGVFTSALFDALVLWPRDLLTFRFSFAIVAYHLSMLRYVSLLVLTWNVLRGAGGCAASWRSFAGAAIRILCSGL